MAPCASPPPEAAPVPPGHRRLLSGQIVREELAAQVLPPPRAGAQERRALEAPPEASPAPCMHPQVAELLEALAVERAARERAEERADLLDQVVLLQAQALAARPAVTSVTPSVTLPMRDASRCTVTESVTGRGGVTLEGGGGEDPAAVRKSLLSAARSRKYREKKKQSAAEATGGGGVTPTVTRDAVTPSVTQPERDAASVTPPPPAPAPVVPPPARKLAEPVVPSADKLFFAWCQEERTARFPESIPERAPARWAAWYAEALAAVGGDEERLRGAWLAWLEDAWGHKCDPVCAAIAFVGSRPDKGTWRRHIPGQRDGAAPAQETPAEARRRADVDVGRGDAPPALEVQDTPAGIAWGRVLGAMREAGGAPAYVAGQLQGRFRAVELAGDCLVLEAPDKFALTLLDEDFGGAALNAAVRALGLSLRATVAGQPADAHAGGIQ